jgi:hypothetical protein
MEKILTFGLAPDQLAALLALGQADAADVAGASPGPAPVLQEWLTTPVVGSPTSADGGPPLTFAQLLEQSEVPLALLRAGKEQAKRLVAGSDSDAERAAGTALYYAVIARAMIVHRVRITTHSARQLAEGMRQLRDMPWVPTSVRDLLAQGIAASKDE